MIEYWEDGVTEKTTHTAFTLPPKSEPAPSALPPKRGPKPKAITIGKSDPAATTKMMRAAI